MDSVNHNGMHRGRHEAEGYRRIELITGVARRRRWTEEEKAEIVGASVRPGVKVSEVARRFGVNRNLLQTWRRGALKDAAIFVPLRVEDAGEGDTTAEISPDVPTGPTSAIAPATGTVEIEARGVRVRFAGPVDTTVLHTVLAHIGRRA